MQYNFFMNYKRIVLAFLFCFCAALVCAEAGKSIGFTEEETELEKDFASSSSYLRIPDGGKTAEPELKSEITGGKTAVVIKTNVSGASVFLNGEYLGRTPLSVHNLVPGSYNLRAELNGYEPVFQRINIKDGREQTYYLQLEKRCGYLDISFLPERSIVYADGLRLYDDVNRLEEGRHVIKVRKFGFEDFSAEVFIRAHRMKRIFVTLKEVPFSVTKFLSSKNTFNPDYSGGIGTCVFTAEVTAPGKGVISIVNSFGEEVRSYTFPEFSDWMQTFSWDGRNSSGSYVPSGVYTAVFTAEGFELRAGTKVDYSVVYNLLDITDCGSGIGSVPVAVSFAQGASAVGISMFPVWRTTGGGYAFPVDAGISLSVTNWLEFSGKVGVYVQGGESSVSGSAALKFAFSKLLASGKIDWGFSVGYGYVQNPLFFPYGLAYGKGANLALMAGYEKSFFFAGVTTQFDYSCSSGALSDTDSVWKNAIALYVMPSRRVSLNIYGALHSAFGLYDEVSESVDESSVDWVSVIETGGGVSFCIPGSSVVMNVSGFSFIFPSSPAYIGCKVCINYLF